MTSQLSCYRVIRSEAVPPQPVPVVDDVDADSAGPADEFDLAPTRRIQDSNEAGSSTAAGRFVGLLLCAGSGALTIWLATLLL